MGVGDVKPLRARVAFKGKVSSARGLAFRFRQEISAEPAAVRKKAGRSGFGQLMHNLLAEPGSRLAAVKTAVIGKPCCNVCDGFSGRFQSALLISELGRRSGAERSFEFA
jgi:hypothetical protein